MPQKKQSLKQLQKVWYAKLKKSGFDDIEQANDPDEMLKRWDSHYFRRSVNDHQFESTQEYYYMATQWVELYNFKNARHKKMWTKYANGDTLRDIAKKHRCAHSTAYGIIDKIRRDMLSGNTNPVR